MKNKMTLKDLKKGSHIHLMGICGTAMASLAGLLKENGFHVTGSDSNPYPPMSTQIESLGIEIMKPYSKNNLARQPDFVIVGNVISANNEEVIEMNRLEIPYCSLPSAMGEFIIAEKNSFVISGTHGKTTTTSMVSWILETAGQRPGFLIGGIPKNFDRSFRTPAQDVFVIEGDEYDTAFFDKVPKFIHYKPQQVILTSVEFDHADIYKDFDHVKSAFIRLMKLIPEHGHLVYWGDDKNVQEVSDSCQIKGKYSFGFSDRNDFQCAILSETAQSTLFQILKNKVKIAEFEVNMIGHYNILNATAAVAITLLNGISVEPIRKALKTFQGVKRRQEIIGEPGGITIIEDFAHHPTAVSQTIEAVQNKYKPRKVFSIFEPRSATSRRKVFQEEYVNSFSKAQECIIAQAFDQSKLDSENRFSADELVDDLKRRNVKAQVLPSADEIVRYLSQNAVKNDVILIMSNGGFDDIYNKLIKSLS